MASNTGDTHPGSTRGGYVLGGAHYEVIDWYWDNGCWCPHHDPICYDCARDYVTNDLLASGVVDAVTE